VQVTLLPGCAGYARDAEQRTVGEWTDDTAIHSIIKARWLADDGVKGLDLACTVKRGVVTVYGTLADATARDRAVAIARAVRGVRDVIDRIVVVNAPGDR
jgi:osmotically-inducible protein OsmY